MKNNKLTVLFILQKARINKQGKCPIRCRITFCKKRKEFATGIFILPVNWNNKKQVIKPPDKQAKYLNAQLSLISQKISKAFLMLQVQEITFDVEDIYLAYKGENTKQNKTFMEVLNLHLGRMEKLVGTEYAPRYYEKWVGTQKLLKTFIQNTYRKNDYLLNKLTMKFIEDLDFYLKSEKNQKQITINKCIQRVRQVVKLAISEGFLDRDPFLSYKPKRYKKEIVYLTQEELYLLEHHHFAQQRLEQVRDMFVFCCYTGLAYAEMSNLRAEHLVKGFDANTWIKMFRKKTKSAISIPLLSMAESILQKYKTPNRLLPVISNQKFNSYLKEIAEIVGIDKKLTHHLARKTFASTVLLYNDVPMEIVSELLGHSKLAVTQEHYAKVTPKKISEQMSKLREKLGE